MEMNKRVARDLLRDRRGAVAMVVGLTLIERALRIAVIVRLDDDTGELGG